MDIYGKKRNELLAETVIKGLKSRNMTGYYAKDKEEALKLYPVVQAMLDKLAKVNIIHANKAANIKSGLAQHISKLG